MLHNNSITTTATAAEAAAKAAAKATATTTPPPPPPPPPPPVVAVPAIEKMAYRHDYTTHVAAKRAPPGRAPGTPAPRWILAEPPRTTPSGIQLWRAFLRRAWRALAKRCGAERVRAALGKRKRE
ncbi:hypothetical protein KC357_g4719 [Hortaea werneckii]|nr:hypothetical protein KC357_g4719 [Hortaea werneckii]